MIATPREQYDEIHEALSTLESGQFRRLTAPVLTPDGSQRIAEWRFTRRHGRIYHWIVRLFEERRGKRVPSGEYRVCRKEHR